MRHFFQDQVGWGSLGYVLIGEKPMAFNVIAEHSTPVGSLYSRFCSWITPRRIQILQGYRVWKKYEKFFPSSRFQIFYEPYQYGNTLMTIVNKERFAETVRAHEEDFKEALGRTITPQELLEEGAEKPFVAEVLEEHTALLGILLGYGRGNALLCHHWDQLETEEEKEAFCKEVGYRSVWPDEVFDDFCKQFESVSWVSSYVTGAHMDDLKYMTLPGFGGLCDSEETLRLCENYKRAKNQLIELYRNKDSLETTLKLFTTP